MFDIIDKCKIKADSIIKDDPLERNMYFLAMKANRLWPERIKTSQISFVHAINHWSKLLAFTISKMDLPEDRLILLNNLMDEHGNKNLNMCHINTFLRNTNQNIEKINITPVISKFNGDLWNFINNSTISESVAALGMIEYTYDRIGEIMNSIYIFDEHYKIHSQIDKNHADDLFSILKRHIIDDETLIKSLKFGYKAIYDVYEGLLDNQDHNIQFANTMEDPLCDIHVINNLKNQNLKACIVCSGGCTAFSIIGPHIKYLDVIDQNQEQIYLAKIKLAAIKLLNENTYLQFLSGDLSREHYINIINTIDDNNAKEYWISKLSWLTQGCIRMGKFEQFFDRLKLSNNNWTKIASIKHLIRLFGENAVKNSPNKFDSLFKNIVQNHTDKKISNYFSSIILFNGVLKKEKPLYIQNFANIKKYANRINFICKDMISLLQVKRDNYYNFISASNLTDWMEIKKAELFSQLCYNKLIEKNGACIMRRLIGNFDLEKNKSKYQSFEILKDQTGFYQNTISLKK